MKSARMGAAAVFALNRAACGGGGDSTTTTTNTATPVQAQTLVLQASKGDLSRFANKFFNSGCGIGISGGKPFSGYASFQFGAATATSVSGVYTFTPSGQYWSCDGTSKEPAQATHFNMTYVSTTAVSSANSSAAGVADVFSLKDNITKFVNTQTFAFDSTYTKLYTSNATAAFTSDSLPHVGR